MAKEEILTLHQKQFLEFASRQDYITKNFYLTGGTVLAWLYLEHRLSEDLDFFNEKEEVNTAVIKRILGEFGKEHSLSKIEHRSIFGINNFFLHFSDKDVLKVDFSYYPFPRIEKGNKFKNLIIDSVYDIAVNKIHTISMQPRARDFIDLYFILKEKDFKIEDLVLKARAKFDWHIDSVQLGIKLMEVKDTKDFPYMLKKIEHQEWQGFFIQEARRLEKKIFKD